MNALATEIIRCSRGLLFFAVIAFPSTVLAQIKIAALVPMTGDLSTYGADTVRGVELAIDEINQSGGVLDGRDIVLELVDTKSDPATAVSAVRQVIEGNRIAGMIGAMSSSVTMQVAQDVAHQQQLPLISNASTAVAISSADDDDFLFRTTAHEAAQGVLLARTVLQQGLQKVSILYVENDYGRELRKLFTERFEKAGGEVVTAVGFAAGRPSYQQHLARASAANVDALFLIADPEDGLDILRQSVEQNRFNRFIFSDRMRTEDLAQTIPQVWLDGAIGSVPQSRDSVSKQHFNSAYEAAYGAKPSHPFIETAYDAAYLLALAIEKARSYEGKAVRDALRFVAGPPGLAVVPGKFERAKKFLAASQDIDYYGAAGLQDFDAAGDVQGSVGIWTVRDGKILELKREQL